MPRRTTPSSATWPTTPSLPATSSASVNGRTRMTSRPAAWASTASSAVKTISPLAAPGDADFRRRLAPYSPAGRVPVYFIGVGEKLEDLETFQSREFAQALLH